MPTYTHPHHAGHRCLATGVLAVAAMQGMVAAVPWHDAHAESDAHADTVTATDTRVHVDESGAAVPGQRPQIKVLGTVDLLLVETTPIVIEGRQVQR